VRQIALEKYMFFMLPDSNKFTKFEDAMRFVCQGNIEELSTCRLHRDDVNRVDPKTGQTLLTQALYLANTGVISFLVGLDDIDVNKKNQVGYAPLHLVTEYAMIFGDANAKKVLDVLLAARPDINILDSNNNTPLISFVQFSFYGCVSRLLMESGLDLDMVNSQQKSAIDIAQEMYHATIGAQFYVAEGAAPRGVRQQAIIDLIQSHQAPQVRPKYRGGD